MRLNSFHPFYIFLERMRLTLFPPAEICRTKMIQCKHRRPPQTRPILYQKADEYGNAPGLTLECHIQEGVLVPISSRASRRRETDPANGVQPPHLGNWPEPLNCRTDGPIRCEKPPSPPSFTP